MRQTWVERGSRPNDDALDQAALAGGVPAVDADDDPAAGAQVMDLQVEQLVLQLLQLVLVGLRRRSDRRSSRSCPGSATCPSLPPAPDRASERGKQRWEIDSATGATTNLVRWPTPEPTIRYVERGGSSGAGGRRHLDRIQPARPAPTARQGAACGARRQRPEQAARVDASSVERLDTAGALEILQLAGGGPDAEIKTAEKAPCRPVRGREGEHGASAPPPRHVNWLTHWLEELGRDLVDLGAADHQSLRLLRRDPRDLRRGLRAAPGASASAPWCARCSRSGSRRC